MNKYLVLALASVLLFSTFSMAKENNQAAKRGFNEHDLVTMQRVSGQTPSPDGKTVVFVLRKTDLDANRGRTDLWLVDIDGKNLKQLTKDKASDFSPIWSKDGKSILFLSTRSGSSQVWRIDVTTGKTEQITKLPLGVSNLKLSPAGDTIAFSLEVFPSMSIDETVKELNRVKNLKTSGRLYDRLFIRHWDVWNDGRRNHIFTMKINGGTPVDLMKGMDADSPLKPFGGSEEFTFTPDGKAIVFTAGNSGKKEAWSTNYDLFKVPADASAKAEVITTNKAWDTMPVFSNNGKTMAYLAMKRPGFEADKFTLILRDVATGKERALTENWDRSVSSMIWSKKDRVIYVTAQNLGQKSLFAINVKKGTVKTLVKMGSVSGVSLAGKKLLFGKNDLKSPVDLFTVDTRGRKLTKITDINKDKLAQIKMGDYEQFTFKGWNDEIVHAYLVKPYDFVPGKKYPVAFLIHGGPQGSFGNKFHYRWNPQSYAGAGYVAIMVDFHGSTGYGQAFTDSISGDWGGKPFIDLQKGLAAAIAKYDFLDKDRVGALGASYGGFMINWIAGNWPDRFRCLVNHDGNLDERLAYYDTEELWFPEWEHEGTPWENPESYEKHNPVNFVKNWKTPMLVIHGALDYRVVDTQGMSTFTALQRKGIPSKFLYFPDENHWVLKPHNSILWHKTVIEWLDQWLKK